MENDNTLTTNITAFVHEHNNSNNKIKQQNNKFICTKCL